MVINGDMLIVSPFIKQSFLLSSSTVFIFSIHSASTGPSRTMNYLSDGGAREAFLKTSPKIPSVHSLDIGSEYPYRNYIGTDFGFMI